MLDWLVGCQIVVILLVASYKRSIGGMIFILPLALYFIVSERIEGLIYFLPLAAVSLVTMIGLYFRAEKESDELAYISFAAILTNALGWWIDGYIDIYIYQPLFILIFLASLFVIGKNNEERTARVNNRGGWLHRGDTKCSQYTYSKSKEKAV